MSCQRARPLGVNLVPEGRVGLGVATTSSAGLLGKGGLSRLHAGCAVQGPGSACRKPAPVGHQRAAGADWKVPSSPNGPQQAAE